MQYLRRERDNIFWKIQQNKNFFLVDVKGNNVLYM